jgi:hypothetical protein
VESLLGGDKGVFTGCAEKQVDVGNIRKVN